MARDLSLTLLVVSIVLIVITSLALGMRLFVKVLSLRIVGREDALITLSWCFSVALNLASALATRVGFGKHDYQFNSANERIYHQLIMVCSTTYSCAITLAKASFAVLYIRLLNKQGRWHMYLNKAVLIFLLCQAIEEVLTVVFQCRPIEKAWMPEVDGTCIPLEPIWYTGFTCNLIVDLILFVQPIPWMWGLRLPLGKRLGLIGIMSIGLFVVVISALRISFVSRIGGDPTYDFAEPMIWSQAEVSALIICSCVPSLRILFRHVPGFGQSGSDSQANLGVGLRGGRQGSAGLTFEDKQAWLAISAFHSRSRSRKTEGTGGTSGTAASRNRRLSWGNRMGTTIRVESGRMSDGEIHDQPRLVADGLVGMGILVTRELERQSQPKSAYETEQGDNHWPLGPV